MTRFRIREQKKRVATYLSNILKEAEKNRDETYKIRMSIQSLQNQRNVAGVGQSQSIKQIQSQLTITSCATLLLVGDRNVHDVTIIVVMKAADNSEIPLFLLMVISIKSGYLEFMWFSFCSLL